MLHEHLAQDHDRASRRSARIDRHVEWIHSHFLGGAPSQILDLACGPGLYSSRLARLGHRCTGIDYSPASIAYARGEAEAHGLACTYHLADLRTAEYGAGYDLAMLIFGELNVFRPDDAERILAKCLAALRPGGLLLLEPHTLAGVERSGRAPDIWWSSSSGLFSLRPHLVLMESVWYAQARLLSSVTMSLTLRARRSRAMPRRYRAIPNRTMPTCSPATALSWSKFCRG
jgi:SAM-dependent methyltransferase